MYSEYSSLLFLLFNIFEMSSIIYANKYCKMTSFAPLPPIPVLAEDSMAVGENLVGYSFRENFYKAWREFSLVLRELSEPLSTSSLRPRQRLKKEATSKMHAASSFTKECLSKWGLLSGRQELPDPVTCRKGDASGPKGHGCSFSRGNTLLSVPHVILMSVPHVSSSLNTESSHLS